MFALRAKHCNRSAVLYWSLSLLAGCSDAPANGPAASASASTTRLSSASAHGSSAAATSASARADDDGDKPVYPVTNDPPDPVAERYCSLVHDASEESRRACCPDMQFTSFRPTGECVRTLSYALRSGAVAIDKGALEACDAAISAAAKVCDWGGELPAACVGIVRGTREKSNGCRSSLECKAGLYCAGLTITKPGTCAAPMPIGQPCGLVDTLAPLVVEDAEREHPQCDGVCLRRCSALVAMGGACTTSLQCGPGHTCVGGHCSDAPLPKAGERCVGGACAAGHRCVQDKCVVERRIGESCASDGECRSGFCEGTGDAGRCAMRCQIISGVPSAAASSSATRP
ncbi:MAG: hypothetical protein U0271_13400 [Polyangiaceae bacterium]